MADLERAKKPSPTVTAKKSPTKGSSLPHCPESGAWNNCIGTYTYPDGDKYVGGWKDDKRNGKGTLTYADGRVEEGIWVNGIFLYAKKPSPTVTAKKSPTKGSSLPHCPESGGWNNCFGIYTRGNGVKYVGEWKDNFWHGQGTLIYPDGRVIEGIFDNGKPSPTVTAKKTTTYYPEHLKRLKETNKCPLCDLQGADLTGADLTGDDFTGANLYLASLEGANLQGANLRGANLRRANLKGVDLRRAYLQGADLQGANLKGANLKGVNLRGAKLDPEDIRIAKASGAINVPEPVVVGKKPSSTVTAKKTSVTPTPINNSSTPTSSTTESADDKIRRLEEEVKRLKIENLEREIARLRGGTATPSASVQQRQAPVRRTPVNTRRHFADDYSCGPDDMSCYDSLGERYGKWSKRAIGGGGSMTEEQYYLTSKILFSRLNPRKFANKPGWMALAEYLLEIARQYDNGKITKAQYGNLMDRKKEEVAKLVQEQENFKNRTNWKRGFFAFTRALQGHLQRQEQNYQEQMKSMNSGSPSNPSHLGMYQRSYMKGMNRVCVYTNGVTTMDGIGLCPR